MVRLTVTSFALLTLKHPHGGPDAFQIWNLRARFLYLRDTHWRDSFSPLLYQASYPILIPCLVARGWLYAGGQTLWVPAVLATLFTFATVGLLYAALAHLRNKQSAMLGTLFLLCAPRFVSMGASQEADVPLAFFFLMTVVPLSLHDRSPCRANGLLPLAGLSAGFAVWTKREGLLFLVAVCATRLLVISLQHGVREAVRQLMQFSLGAIPVLAVFIYFKLAVVPTDTFATSQGLRATASRLADISRHVLILRAFVRDGILLAGWTSSVALVATASLLLLGLNRTHLRDRSVLTIVGVLVLMLGGYWIVYAITPFPIHWHLRTSLNRLLLQLWPTGVFALFLFVSEGPKAPAAPLLGDRIKP